MDTTTHGIPYPEPADAVLDYPAVAQTVAELLDELLFPIYDSDDVGVSFPAANIVTPALDQTFRDLVIDIYARTNSASVGVDGVAIQVNGDNGANYDSIQTQTQNPAGGGAIVNTAQTVGGTSMNGTWANGGASLAGAFAWARWIFPDYASTTRRKIMVAQGFGKSSDLNTGPLKIETGGGWRSVAAISTIAFIPLAGSFAAGTRIRIRGRK